MSAPGERERLSPEMLLELLELNRHMPRVISRVAGALNRIAEAVHASKLPRERFEELNAILRRAVGALSRSAVELEDFADAIGTKTN